MSPFARAMNPSTLIPTKTDAFMLDSLLETVCLGLDDVLAPIPGDDPAGSSAGRYLGQGAWPGAVGHLGFTGVSLWIDRGRRLVVALCTNRTALGRAETRIRAFRPRFHDAVVEALDLP